MCKSRKGAAHGSHLHTTPQQPVGYTMSRLRVIVGKREREREKRRRKMMGKRA